LFIPKSRLGRHSIIAIVLFVVFFILGRSIHVTRGPFENPSFFNDPISATLTIIAGLCGVFALFSGLWAIIRNRERAIPVIASTLIGLFVLLFWVGEVLSPS
jgi:hypothetical protein